MQFGGHPDPLPLRLKPVYWKAEKKELSHLFAVQSDALPGLVIGMQLIPSSAVIARRRARHPRPTHAVAVLLYKGGRRGEANSHFLFFPFRPSLPP